MLEGIKRILDIPSIPMFKDFGGTLLHHWTHIRDARKLDHTVESIVVSNVLQNIRQRLRLVACWYWRWMVDQSVEVTEVCTQQAEAFGSGLLTIELVCIAQMNQRMAHYNLSVIETNCNIKRQILASTNEAIHE